MSQFESEENESQSSIRLYTLGRFSLVKEGNPVAHKGKGHNKPIELLKVLIALGGREIAEEKISEALWPDADGDLSHLNFKTTLHRLRKLIGDEAIHVQDVHITLNPSYCWVDVWDLERRLSELNELMGQDTSSANELYRYMIQALEIYQGPFLGREDEHAWALSLRERVRSRLLHTIKELIPYLGQELACDQAISLYQKTLELDDLAEEYYYGLMACYAGLDRRAEALSIYGRCRTMLDSVLGITPSAATEVLHQAIQNNDKTVLSRICAPCRARHQALNKNNST